MARQCLLTGRIRQIGHNVSHANNRTKRVFNINLQNKRIFIPWLNRFVRVKLSTKALRIIDKLGVKEAFLRLKKKDPHLFKQLSKSLGNS
ncbi:MAG: 50S ribosomal protein L28 [Deltaproteobacteria bacterium]|nr:50S ribosomal protein L28 [Deltaproteobacteria bacterium]